MGGTSAASPRRVEAVAPAKVNLFLHVIGRRADGYHLLESVFAFADFGDRVQAEQASHLRFQITGTFAEACKRAGGAGEGNLVMRAARALHAKLGRKGRGAAIALKKNLPVAAGLGGGSSDAAATLKALQVLWNVETGEEELFDLALSLGADVPACLLGEPCFVSGIGENVTPLDRFEDLHCVLANPGVSLPTAVVFKAFAERELSFSLPLGMRPEASADLWGLLENTRNDLEAAACGLEPEVGKALLALRTEPGAQLARMSGSGATSFALFATRREAEASASRLAARHRHWWVKACTLGARTGLLAPG